MHRRIWAAVILFCLMAGQGGWAADIPMVQIAGGGAHNLALKRDYSLWVWGRNDFKQLTTFGGTGGASPQLLTRVNGQEVTLLVAGPDCSAVLRQDGSALAWGNNARGKLSVGPETDTIISIPTAVLDSDGLQEVTGIQSIAAGRAFLAWLRADKTVWYSGDIHGQLIGQTLQPVPGLAGIEAIAAASAQLFALCGGQVLGVGWNAWGQLGDGTQTDRDVPSWVMDNSGDNPLTGVVQVAAGYSHTLSLMEDGTVWAWGQGEYGALGNGEATAENKSLLPVPVLTAQGEGHLTDIIKIAAGKHVSMALARNGNAYIWGKSAGREAEDLARPRLVASRVADIVCGDAHQFFVLNNEQILARGDNTDGQTGVAEAGDYVAGPTVCRLSPLLGDVDGDQVVSLADLTELAKEYGRTGKKDDPTGDSIIDIYDLVLVARRIRAP